MKKKFAVLNKLLWCLVAVISLCQTSWAKAGLSELTPDESQLLRALLMIGSVLFYLPSWSALILFVTSLSAKGKMSQGLFIAGISALLTQFILQSQVSTEGIVEDMRLTFRLLTSPAIQDEGGCGLMLTLPSLGFPLALAEFAISSLIHSARWFVRNKGRWDRTARILERC